MTQYVFFHILSQDSVLYNFDIGLEQRDIGVTVIIVSLKSDSEKIHTEF